MDSPLDKKINGLVQELEYLMKQKQQVDIAECKKYIKDNDLSDMYKLDYGRINKLSQVYTEEEGLGGSLVLTVRSQWIDFDTCQGIYDNSDYCSDMTSLKQKLSKYKKDDSLRDLWALATSSIKNHLEVKKVILDKASKLYISELKSINIGEGQVLSRNMLKKVDLKLGRTRVGRQSASKRVKMLTGKMARKYGLSVTHNPLDYDKSLLKILVVRAFRDPESNVRYKYPKLRRYKDNYHEPEFRRKPRVPVSTEVMNSICKQCAGFCCDRFFLTGNKNHLMEWSVGYDQKSALFYAENFVEVEPEVARKAGSCGSVAYTCLKFDKDTKLCTAYDQRPDMCKSYRCPTVMKGQLPTKRAEDFSPIP